MEATILIADDDESVRRMIARVLETAGYEAVQAANWFETVSRQTAVEPSLILLDLELLSREHAEILTAMNRRAGRTPVIGLAGWPDQRAEALRRGVDVVMEKPLDLGNLLETVHELLARGQPTETKPDPKPPFSPARRSPVAADAKP